MSSPKPQHLLALLLLGVVLSGCATHQKREVDREPVNLNRIQAELPESQLLDVRIQTFDPGKLPEEKKETRGLSDDIRQAEALFIPVHLKTTMQQTGYWGAVRVVPAGTLGAEVLISGRIIQSDGEVLELEIDVRDATGTRWFTRTYGSIADSSSYSQSVNRQYEVFQNLYNRIANDCAEYRAKLTPKQINSIRQIAEMRFATAFSPTAFNGYLRQTKDKKKQPFSFAKFMAELNHDNESTNNQDAQKEPSQYSIDRLPAEDDPMLLQVRRVRERDYLLVDTLDDQYDGLYRDIGEIYTNWRQSRMLETEMIRKIKHEADMQRIKGALLIAGAILVASASHNSNYSSSAAVLAGGMVVVGANELIEAGDKEDESAMNKAALEELGVSFSSDVMPVVVDVEGKTVELTGSADAIYKQWREVLGRLHKKEAGEFTPPTRPANDTI